MARRKKRSTGKRSGRGRGPSKAKLRAKAKRQPRRKDGTFKKRR